MAVYLLGGDADRVATEHVAMKASTISPGRFAWKQYPEQVDKEAVRKRLDDAKRPDYGAYLSGSSKNGWMLTRAGYAFAKVAARRLTVAHELARQPTARGQNWRRSERLRILSSETFRKYRAEGPASLTPREAEDFFRVDDYVTGEARERKISRLTDAFADDPELGQFVNDMATKAQRRGS